MGNIPIADKVPGGLYSATEFNQMKNDGINDNDTRISALEGSSLKTTKPVSSNTVAEGGDVLIVDATSGDITVTLPVAGDNENKIIEVLKKDSSSNIIIVDGDGSETISGDETKNITNQYDSISVISDGTEWYII